MKKIVGLLILSVLVFNSCIFEDNTKYCEGFPWAKSPWFPHEVGDTLWFTNAIDTTYFVINKNIVDTTTSICLEPEEEYCVKACNGNTGYNADQDFTIDFVHFYNSLEPSFEMWYAIDKNNGAQANQHLKFYFLQGIINMIDPPADTMTINNTFYSQVAKKRAKQDQNAIMFVAKDFGIVKYSLNDTVDFWVRIP